MYLLGSVLLFLVAFYCLYGTLFYGWLTATPLTTDAELPHIQFLCYLHFWSFVASSILFLLLLAATAAA